MKKVSFKQLVKIWKLTRRKFILSIIILLTFIIGYSAYRASETYYLVFDEMKPKVMKFNEYEIDAVFYEENKIIEGKEKITYINKTKHSLDSIYFHIYPNVFSSKETVPFHENEINLAYRKGFEPGYIKIQSVNSSSSDLSYIIMGKSNSILKVNLDRELHPNEKTNIYIDFVIKIPPANGRFGYGENTVNIGNWYPIASVIDDKGWNLEPYYSIGDPFYSETSNYRVTITMPQNYIIASTGDLIKKENIDGKFKWTFEADKVRDFAIIASPKFKVLEDEVEDTYIRTYYFEDNAAELSLEAARDAIKIFSELFGKYPYKHFSVAASDFYIGGMEYPKLVYINEGFYKGNDEILEYVIVHEAAHQWWYGIVGNNEIKEAWLDEALTEYSTMLYYEEKYGKEKRDTMYEKMILDSYNRYRKYSNKDKEVILKELKDFNDSKEYQALVYCKGAMFIENLRRELGDKDFFDALKIYYDKYKYSNATTSDFIKVCELVSNRELEKIFNKWLVGQEE